MYSYIAIEGNIGAGKTSLATMLAGEFNSQLVLEQFAENEFLPLFYKEPQKNAFPLEMSFLITRYEQLIDLNPETKVVSDYAYFKSLVFAQNNLPANEFQLFEKYYNNFNKQLKKLDIIVYLDSEVNTLKQNIFNRNRGMEKGISDDYLASITEKYEKFIRGSSDLPFLWVKVNGIDFVKSIDAFKKIKMLLEKEYKPGIFLYSL